MKSLKMFDSVLSLALVNAINANMNEVFDYSWTPKSPKYNDTSQAGSSQDLPDRKANYFILESENSNIDEDTESVASVQSKETDYVRNTTDTDTKSEYDIEIEYEVASSQEGGSRDHHVLSSSNEEDIVMAAVSAVYNNQRKEPTVSDDDTPLQAIFTWCSECHKRNDHPHYRCCSKCYKVKKSIFPPRPRKGRRNLTKPKNPKLENIKSCTSSILSQDSGVGCSQEYSSMDSQLVADDLNKPGTSRMNEQGENRSEIKKYLKRKYSSSLEEDEPRSSLSQSDDDAATKKRKEEDELETSLEELKEDQSVELKERLSLSVNKTVDNVKEDKTTTKRKSCSNSDNESPRKKSRLSPTFKEPITSKSDPQLGCIFPASTSGVSSNSSTLSNQSDSSKVCIICNSAETNGAFVHGMSAHLCCCYTCATKIYKTTKRCPACNRKILSVHKVFKA